MKIGHLTEILHKALLILVVTTIFYSVDKQFKITEFDLFYSFLLTSSFLLITLGGLLYLTNKKNKIEFIFIGMLFFLQSLSIISTLLLGDISIFSSLLSLTSLVGTIGGALVKIVLCVFFENATKE